MLIKNVSLDSNFIISILSENHSYRQPPAHGNSENNSRALFIRHRHLEDTGNTLGGFEFHKLTRIFKNIASLHFDARNTDNAILPYSCPINTQTLNTLFTKPSMYYILAHHVEKVDLPLCWSVYAYAVIYRFQFFYQVRNPCFPTPLKHMMDI